MSKDPLRSPAVSGQFYPAQKDKLASLVQSFFDHTAVKQECLGCLLPHAGLIYSGAVTGKTISQVRLKERIVLLGPNHYGTGKPFSLSASGAWQTPLGEVTVDSESILKLAARSRYLNIDPAAHQQEHSLEVELPFLQIAAQAPFKIVPIAFLSDDLAALKAVGKEIADFLKEEGLIHTTLLIASSDMTHYEHQREAERKDHAAIETLTRLDEDGLYRLIKDMDISMCGYAPAVTLLSCLKTLGATRGELIAYQTSGMITGDTSEVVGYAGMIFH